MCCTRFKLIHIDTYSLKQIEVKNMYSLRALSILLIIISANLHSQPYDIFGLRYNEGKKIGWGDVNDVYELIPTSKKELKNEWYVKKARDEELGLGLHSTDKFGSFMSYALGLGPKTVFNFDADKQNYFFQKKAPGKEITYDDFAKNRDIRLALLTLLKNIVLSGLQFDDIKFSNMNYDDNNKKFWLFDTGVEINDIMPILMAKEIDFPPPNSFLRKYEYTKSLIESFYRQSRVQHLLATDLEQVQFPEEKDITKYYASDDFKYLFYRELAMIGSIITSLFAQNEENAERLKAIFDNVEGLTKKIAGMPLENISVNNLEKINSINRAMKILFSFNKLKQEV